ncbi:MAG: hypothetical protein AMJ68_10610, partial [Acidithiobacillales bacterium SG8_45]
VQEIGYLVSVKICPVNLPYGKVTARAVKATAIGGNGIGKFAFAGFIRWRDMSPDKATGRISVARKA